jgi:putative oxidoreductase
VHLGNGWLFTAPKGGWEYPAFLTLAAVVVGLLGEGRYAVGFGPSPARAAAGKLQRAG